MGYQDLLKILSGLKNSADDNNLHNLILVGGVHGSGKTSLCESISKDIPDAVCVVASKLLNHQNTQKRVSDINKNQILLSKKINEVKSNNTLTIVDGHYCVSDLKGEIKYVGLSIFEILTPAIIVLVQAPAPTIQKRIMLRDHIQYTIDFITRMANMECYWAVKTSEKLNIPLFIFNG